MDDALSEMRVRVLARDLVRADWRMVERELGFVGGSVVVAIFIDFYFEERARSYL